MVLNFSEKENDVFYRNVCPRNCYSTCSMLSFVKNGKLIKVTGDPKHGYTEGKLCAKGYAYTQYVYSPLRLKYPLLQTKRGSGNWKRISWDEAYERIASKIVELNKRYGSNLASGYNAFSGNLGFLHFALQGMFESFGPHTKPTGNLCLTTGREALQYNVPYEYNPPPESMINSKLIVLWGTNPARTNIHQMKFILRAREKGATFVVIDPIFTETAKLADIYIQIRPGMDGLLIMGIVKEILLNNWLENNYIELIEGWEEFEKQVEHTRMDDVVKETGVSEEAIKELAFLYSHVSPVSTWIGFGMQRRLASIQNIRAIDALTTITGNRIIENGGLFYFHPEIEKFPLAIMNQGKPNQWNREIDINHFAKEALQLSDPPLKFLWINSRNPLSQDQQLSNWDLLFKQLELVVTTDLYMTHTAKMSDIVLPTTTQFEEMDLHVSYWNHWLSLNQKTIDPLFEARSDLEIVKGLVKKLNEKKADFSSFPIELEAIDWVKKELTDEVKERYGIVSWEELLQRPYELKSEFRTVYSQVIKQDKPFIFTSKKAVQDGLPLLPIGVGKYDLQQNQFMLLTPQSLLKIHSQFTQLSWLKRDCNENTIFINSLAAKKLDLKQGDEVVIYNENGEIIGKVSLDESLLESVAVMSQGGETPINQLIDTKKSNEGQIDTKGSTLFYDIYVSIRKVGRK